MSQKKALTVAVLFGIIICITLMLSPLQKIFASFVKEDTSHFLSLPFVVLVLLLFALGCLFSKQISVFLENVSNTRFRLFLIITSALLLILLCFIGIFSYQRGWQWLDSDHASEMILGKLLAEENTFVSTNWRYSTELRLVYQTLFTMPLFKILGFTENWALIRAINIVLNNFVLLASFFFMMKQFKVQLKWIILTSFFLILPLSYEYWNIMTFGGYYIFYVAQFFCCIGLFKKITNNDIVIKKTSPLFILFLLLSFVLGVQGIRAIFGFFLPLLVTCIIIKNKKILFTSISGFICCSIGYGVNCLLQYILNFYAFETMRIENTANFFSKFGQSLVQLGNFFGIASGSPVISAQGFFSIAAIIAAFVLLRITFKQGFKPPYHFLSLFFAVSVIVNIFVFIFSDKAVTARFFIPFMVFYIPLAAILFEYSEKHFDSLKRIAIVFGIVLFIFAKGAYSFQNLVNRNTNSVRIGYIEYLQKNNLEFGFATFWNANVTTELSNGKIEMSGLEISRTPGKLFRLHDYLIKEQYYDWYYYTGESFLLLTRSEWDMVRNRSRADARPVPSYEDNNFVVIRFPTAAQIHYDYLEQ